MHSSFPRQAEADSARYGVDVRTPLTEAGLRYLRKEDGLDEILSVIQTSLPARLYETAYALAIEVASADLHVEQEELRFLQMLRDQLELDKLVVAAIERSARVRYRVM